VLVSVVVVAALYIALQVGVLGSLPWQQLMPLPDGSLPPLAQHLASAIVEQSFGRVAGVAVTILVLVTAFASVYGNLLGFSRIPFAAAQDGNFFKPFSIIHPRAHFPNIALIVIGVLAIAASWFTLDQVISALTAGTVLIQAILQIVAVFAMRRAGTRPAFAMPLFPLPALIALAGWLYVFYGAGYAAMAFGVGTLAIGFAFGWYYLNHTSSARSSNAR
jgi:amino acid transporter